MTEKRHNNNYQHSRGNTGKRTSPVKGNDKNANEVLKLQSMIGNRAVSDMMSGSMGSMSTATEIKLPESLLSKMEQSFGTSFSDVKVHEDPKALALGARAYTQGNNIVFAPGQYSPGTHTGQSLLGHELSHVVQQREGKVRRPSGGSTVNLDRHLEKSADMEGERASTGRQASSTHTSGPAAQMKSIDNSSAPVQASLFGAIGNFAKKAWSGVKSFGKKALNFGMKAGQSFVANGGLQMLAGMYANKQAGGSAMQGFMNSGGMDVAAGMLGGGQGGGQAGGQAGGQQAGGGDPLMGIAGLLSNLLGGGQQNNQAVLEAGSDAHQQAKKKEDE